MCIRFASACTSDDGRQYAWQDFAEMSLLICPRRSGASLRQRCQELRLVTMEIAMPRIVARIPSGQNIRVSDRLFVKTGRMKRHHPASQQVVPGILIDGATTFQLIDGVGVSESFQQSSALYDSRGLVAQSLHQIPDRLFHPQTRSGFTILHPITGSSPIQHARRRSRRGGLALCKRAR
jgi:hypothetical protein